MWKNRFRQKWNLYKHGSNTVDVFTTCTEDVIADIELLLKGKIKPYEHGLKVLDDYVKATHQKWLDTKDGEAKEYYLNKEKFLRTALTTIQENIKAYKLLNAKQSGDGK